MNWHDSVFALIDLRTFSNGWFWIVLALVWSQLVHVSIGVPHDMVLRARRDGGAAMDDLCALAAIQARRRIRVMRRGGVWLTGLASAALTVLALLGFAYGIEFAQGLSLLLTPIMAVLVLSQRLAGRILATSPAPEQLTRLLTWHRVQVQGVGLLAILVTSVWGTLSNLSLTVLSQ